MNLTSKQIELLKVVSAANPDGSAVDMDQILERLPYKTSKESLQFSVRALIAKGLVDRGPRELRRTRRRVPVHLTELGKQMFGKRKPESFVSDIGAEDELEDVFEFLFD